MMILSVWWVRIILTLLIAVAGMSAVALLELDAQAMTAVFYGVLASALLLIEVSRPGGSLFSSGLGVTRSSPTHLALGALLAIAGLLAIAICGLMLNAEFVAQAGTIEFELLIFLLLASAGEEILFRGTIFEALRERFGSLAAVASTSLLFGIAHSSNPGSSWLAVVNVTLAGVLLGTLVIKTQSLWMPLAFHAVWNLTTKLFIGSVSGGEKNGWITTLDTQSVKVDLVWLIDGPFGIEQGLATTVFLVAATMFAIAWVPVDRMSVAARLRRDRIEGALR